MFQPLRGQLLQRLHWLQKCAQRQVIEIIRFTTEVTIVTVIYLFILKKVYIALCHLLLMFFFLIEFEVSVTVTSVTALGFKDIIDRLFWYKKLDRPTPTW